MECVDNGHDFVLKDHSASRYEMKLFSLIKLALFAPAVPAEVVEGDRLRIRKLISLRSHGNVRLQSGAFYTKQDVNVKYDRYKDVKFATGA